MIRIRDLSLPPDGDMARLVQAAARQLRISPNEIKQLDLKKKSVDARKKNDVRIIYTVDVAVKGREDKILKMAHSPKASIARDTLYSVPQPQALPDSLEAIARANLIILGPGSLYTSIIPNFLVDGIADAIRRSRAVKALVLNVMTQDGETEGYTASDHVKAILHHAGPNVVDVCVANSRPVPEESLAPYLAEGAEPLRLDREEIMALGVAVREFPLCSSGRYIRHNPDELAKAVLDVWKEFRIR